MYSLQQECFPIWREIHIFWGIDHVTTWTQCFSNFVPWTLKGLKFLRSDIMKLPEAFKMWIFFKNKKIENICPLGHRIKHLICKGRGLLFRSVDCSVSIEGFQRIHEPPNIQKCLQMAFFYYFYHVLKGVCEPTYDI